MCKKIKIAVLGACGRMGQTLVRLIHDDKEILLSDASVEKNSPNAGRDAGSFGANKKTNITLSSDIEQIIKNADVLIDFTTAGSTIEHTELCAKYNKKIIIGTTGVAKNDLEIVKNHAQKTPILLSANFSVGINLIAHTLEKANSILYDNKFNVTIDETHHVHKIDSPSGTALYIANSICKNNSKYNMNDLNINAYREGEIIGIHNTTLENNKEKIEFNHKAFNRDVFAEGAIFAAKWINKKYRNFDNSNMSIMSMLNIFDE